MDLKFELIKEHCLQLLAESRCSKMAYHNVEHTIEVFENVQTIGKFENVSAAELKILKIAALFHDTGFVETYTGHEDVSIINAIIYLTQNDFSEEIIAEVVKCIKATKMPQKPVSKLERIICDADLFHLASEDYAYKAKLLQKELKVFLNLEYSDEFWLSVNIEFLKQHQFHSNFGELFLKERKIQNILKLENLKVKGNKILEKKSLTDS